MHGPVSATRDMREPMRRREPSAAQGDIGGEEERGVSAERDVELIEWRIARQSTVAASRANEEPLRVKPHRYDEVPPLVHDDAPEQQEQQRTRIEPRERVAGRSRVGSRMMPARGRMQAVSAATAAEEPVVHVSIGRIEVRAVAPPAASIRAPRRNPIMTIEEYVTKRKGRS